MNYKILIILLFVFLASCRTESPIHKLTKGRYDLPPGTIEISPNVFMDESEVSNFSYLEFMYWMQRVYGKDSKEYLDILPDEGGWYELGETYLRLSAWYLQHPVYKSYPVVNITYSQAKSFCKWRSDRVMEYILIINKVIDNVVNPTKDSAFTIERYFAGNYKGIVPNKNFMFYPQYSLPDSINYMRSLKVSDSLYKVNHKYLNRTSCFRNFTQVHCLENITGTNDSLHYGPDPTVEAYCIDIRRIRFHKITVMSHLTGNVREFTNIKGVTFGGSYYDSCSVIQRNYFQKGRDPNCYTGFRCKCTYKVWEAGK